MRIGRLIEIEKPYFGVDKNGEITYERSEIEKDDFYYVEYATMSNIKELLAEGYTVLYYRNPDRKNGLWNHMVSNTDAFEGHLGFGSPIVYDYKIVCLDVENLTDLDGVALN
jgi:hypothetical protein